MYSYGPPHMAEKKQDDLLESTYSSYVRIRDVALRICQKQGMIGRSGETGSGISILTARHDDDDDDMTHRLNLYRYYQSGLELICAEDGLNIFLSSWTGVSPSDRFISYIGYLLCWISLTSLQRSSRLILLHEQTDQFGVNSESKILVYIFSKQSDDNSKTKRIYFFS